jgi:hypothetical protein
MVMIAADRSNRGLKLRELVESIPQSGTNSIDVGRTKVATPMATPAPASHDHDQRVPSRLRNVMKTATSKSDAVTPSVITAAVYDTSAG